MLPLAMGISPKTLICLNYTGSGHSTFQTSSRRPRWLTWTLPRSRSAFRSPMPSVALASGFANEMTNFQPLPVLKSGGDRALVVTPAKRACYCFGAHSGGDVIALVAHIRGVDMKDAANYLQSQIDGQADEGKEKGFPEERVKGDDEDVEELPEALDLSRTRP